MAEFVILVPAVGFVFAAALGVLIRYYQSRDDQQARDSFTIGNPPSPRT